MKQKTKKKKGFTLVELMVVVAIVAILSAVALPMYATFRQRSKASQAIKSCGPVAGALQNWYGNRLTFSGLSVATSGGAIMHGGKRIGAGIPSVPDVDWLISNPSASVVRINWNFTDGCPSDVCDGYYQMTCQPENDKCVVAITLDASNSLGLNQP